MPRSVYAWDLSASECPTCGAAVVAALGIQDAACEECATAIALPPRSRDPVEVPPEEAARIAGLFEQLGRFDPKGPLVAWLPHELQRFELMIAQPEQRAAGLAGLRRAWEDGRRRLAQEEPGADAAVFRVGLGLGRLYAECDEHARSRAVLETALSILPERPQRDMVRCRLARHALRAGDEDAHAAWLSDCDPHPIALEVDGELRSTRALAAYRREDWSAVLEALGRSHRDVPLAFPIAPLGLCLRAHALAGHGDHEAAKDEIRHLSSTVPMGYVRAKQTFARHPGPAGEYAIAVARKASPAPTPRTQPVAQPTLPQRTRRWWWFR